mgnify:FL=1|jgi:hypothetical protein
MRPRLVRIPTLLNRTHHRPRYHLDARRTKEGGPGNGGPFECVSGGGAAGRQLERDGQAVYRNGEEEGGAPPPRDVGVVFIHTYSAAAAHYISLILDFRERETLIWLRLISTVPSSFLVCRGTDEHPGGRGDRVKKVRGQVCKRITTKCCTARSQKHLEDGGKGRWRGQSMTARVLFGRRRLSLKPAGPLSTRE